MRHLLRLLAAAALVLSTAAARADLGDQLFKLLPDDGAELDKFGWSVAVSGATAIVGVWWDDDNGSNSGSAYLFDAAGCPEDPDGNGMVTLCHVPPGNPDNAHTITVGVNAAPAHLAHGDHCGPCEEDEGLLLHGGGAASHRLYRADRPGIAGD